MVRDNILEMKPMDHTTPKYYLNTNFAVIMQARRVNYNIKIKPEKSRSDIWTDQRSQKKTDPGIYSERKNSELGINQVLPFSSGNVCYLVIEETKQYGLNEGPLESGVQKKYADILAGTLCNNGVRNRS